MGSIVQKIKNPYVTILLKVKSKNKKSSPACGPSLPRPALTRKLGRAKFCSRIKIPTQPTIFSGSGGPTRGVEPVLPPLPFYVSISFALISPLLLQTSSPASCSSLLCTPCFIYFWTSNSIFQSANPLALYPLPEIIPLLLGLFKKTIKSNQIDPLKTNFF